LSGCRTWPILVARSAKKGCFALPEKATESLG
jgi:hypothetical protein